MGGALDESRTQVIASDSGLERDDGANAHLPGRRRMLGKNDVGKGLGGAFFRPLGARVFAHLL